MRAPRAIAAEVDARQDAGGIDWDALVTLVGIREFGDQVELVARHVGIGNRASGLPFASVGHSGVDTP
jgi:hypothetical protein